MSSGASTLDPIKKLTENRLPKVNTRMKENQKQTKNCLSQRHLVLFHKLFRSTGIAFFYFFYNRNDVLDALGAANITQLR